MDLNFQAHWPSEKWGTSWKMFVSGLIAWELSFSLSLFRYHLEFVLVLLLNRFKNCKTDLKSSVDCSWRHWLTTKSIPAKLSRALKDSFHTLPSFMFSSCLSSTGFPNWSLLFYRSLNLQLSQGFWQSYPTFRGKYTYETIGYRLDFLLHSKFYRHSKDFGYGLLTIVTNRVSRWTSSKIYLSLIFKLIIFE